jgi:hypothetical protein
VTLLNRLDFIVGALVLSSLVSGYKISWQYVVILLILTPIIHKLSNILAFALKLKKVPY